jgi:hypothetical protein
VRARLAMGGMFWRQEMGALLRSAHEITNPVNHWCTGDVCRRTVGRLRVVTDRPGREAMKILADLGQFGKGDKDVEECSPRCEGCSPRRELGEVMRIKPGQVFSRSICLGLCKVASV